MTTTEIDNELATIQSHIADTQRAIDELVSLGDFSNAAANKHAKLTSQLTLLKIRVAQLSAERPKAELQVLLDNAAAIKSKFEQTSAEITKQDAKVRSQLAELFEFKNCPFLFTEIVEASRPVYELIEENKRLFAQYRTAYGQASSFAVKNGMPMPT